MNRAINLTILVASIGLVSACTDEPIDGDNTPPSGSTSGDESSTFDHMNDGISPWELLDRLQKEGPPRYTSKVHSCPKVRYATLGRVLTSLGVANVGGTAAALSAADLYNSGDNAMGAPNYANRIRENIGISTSGASREFDIFAAAAPGSSRRSAPSTGARPADRPALRPRCSTRATSVRRVASPA